MKPYFAEKKYFLKTQIRILKFLKVYTTPEGIVEKWDIQ